MPPALSSSAALASGQTAPEHVATAATAAVAVVADQTLPVPQLALPVQIVAPAAPLPEAQADPAPDANEIECVAKIIMHEAAYEPRAGRVAVAQVVRARVRSGRFAPSACGVARQRGQFFDVDAFRPARSSAAWSEAVAIATQTLSEADGEEQAPGALFFHAAYSPMPGHTRVTQIGGHVFYR
ncbi:cell wall hydrolase [Sphingomonas sp.]|uniref:cell wall hydrolase n=1 Tax=Sphingomonas sp. TaxID=28214 RepID=UPI003CC56BBB